MKSPKRTKCFLKNSLVHKYDKDLPNSEAKYECLPHTPEKKLDGRKRTKCFLDESIVHKYDKYLSNSSRSSKSYKYLPYTPEKIKSPTYSPLTDSEFTFWASPKKNITD